MILIMLLAALAVLLGLLLVSFAGKHDERVRIAELEQELVQAQGALGAAAELAVELERMESAQEKLLFMFGVQGAASTDSLGTWSDGEPASASIAMQRAATLVLNPGPNRWPAVGVVSQEFIKGNRARGIRPHLGIDVAGRLDTPVLAAGGGTVFRTGQDEYLGNFVEIQHGLGYLTVYGHCSRVAVRKGDAVEAGQVIAYMGTSGQSTAVHLHFEVWQQGEAIDPRALLEGDPARN
ncbi:MAG: M23 family metallopeptidase [Gemmatimonadales bacterium]|nr:M23 family metallopeptidase [Gemmatimonadales bacterium]